MANGIGENISRANKFYNRASIWLLEHFGYRISEKARNKHIANHIVLIGFCVGLCINSFITLNEVGIYIVIFHLLTLLYKATIAFFYMWNWDQKQAKQTNSVSPLSNLKNSPYFVEFFVFCSVLIIAAIASLFCLFSHDPLMVTVFCRLVVDVSIVLNCLFDVYNGIKALYMAAV